MAQGFFEKCERRERTPPGCPNQIGIWKKQLLESAPEIFNRGKDHAAEAAEVERDRLYRKVGQLQVEVDWLKKRPVFWTDGACEACHG